MAIPIGESKQKNLEFDAGTSHIIDSSRWQTIFNEGGEDIRYHNFTFTNGGSHGSLAARHGQDVYFNKVDFQNNGNLSGRHFIDSLIFHPDRRYEFFHQDTTTVAYLESNGLCDGLISIISLWGTSNIQQLAGDLRVTNTVVKNITGLGGADFTAETSVDLGANRNWRFDPYSGSDRYWVGGEGLWNDVAHWSTTSGGPGGACVPTLLDDVYFDANSFSAPNQAVTLEGEDSYCRNITWSEVPNPIFRGYWDLWINGSLSFVPEMTVEYLDAFFVTDSVDQTIDLAGNMLANVFFSGRGSWRMLDSLYVNYGIWFADGDIDTDGHKVNFERAWINSADHNKDKRLLKIDSSHLFCRQDNAFDGGWYVNLQSYEISTGGSLLEFVGNQAGTHHYDPLDNEAPAYHNVLFSDPTGTGFLERNNYRPETLTFNKVHFLGNGDVFGSHSFDSLLFSPGKSYRLQSDGTQIVNSHLQIRGNNCAPIAVSSTTPGLKSTVRKTDGTVEGDFIQMQDQIAIGGASFFAGSNSTNIGNSNSGWNFEDSPDHSDFGLLGEDQVLCDGGSIALDASSNTIGETYSWSTGSSDPQLMVDASGAYSVEVVFGNNCTLIDTVQILGQEDFAPQLGDDTTLCEGASILLDATAASNGVIYEWQDGSNDATFQADTGGQFTVTLELAGCVSSDTIEIDYVSTAAIDIGEQITICTGDVFDLGVDLNRPDALYTWSTGSNQNAIAVSQPGIYWVEVSLDNCSARDTVTLQTIMPPSEILSPTLEFCEGDEMLLSADIDDATFLWSDSSVQQTIRVDTAGSVWVQVAIDQCVVRDTTEINLKPLPELNLPPDTLLCPKQTLEIDLQDQQLQYVWQDGTVANQYLIDESGTFWVEATLDGCSHRDTIQIDFHDALQFDLGPDTIICDVDQLLLDASLPQTVDYTWNTGSNERKILTDSFGVYMVTVDDGTCLVSDTILVESKSCIFYTVFVPNAFTPNHDGVNDMLEVSFPPNLEITNYQMQIFNRWGGLIYDATDLDDAAWDGFAGSEMSDPGVYIYHLQVSYIDDHGPGNAQSSGTVTLIK